MAYRRRLIIALLVLLATAAGTVLGYLLLAPPGVSFLQALYMTVITLAGVGYAEIIDTSYSPALRVFNMFVVLVGVAITVYVFSSFTAFLVETDVRGVFRRRRMQKRITELTQHFIICGLGDTGRYTIQELQKTAAPFIIIESNLANVEKFREQDALRNQDILYIVGDAADETILDQAGIDRAKGLIAAVGSDKDNLVITVMAHQKNPALRIVSRCTDLKFSERMVRAGAASTVSPDHIGGLRLASEVLRPHVVNFLDLMLKETANVLRIDEVIIDEGSPWIGHSLEKLKLREAYNLLPLAVKNSADVTTRRFWVNPPDTLVMAADSVIIVMGDVADVQRARHDSQSRRTNAGAAGASR
jgi:voltage-gated potassium channel